MRRRTLECAEPRFLAASLAAAIVIVGAAWVGKGLAPRSAGKIAIALVQGAAASCVILLMVRGLRQLDELQRRIHLEAVAVAFAGTAILVTCWGFLEKAGAPEVRWSLWVWPAMTVLWAAGLLVAGRRYR